MLTWHKELQYGTFRRLLEIVLEEWKGFVWWKSHSEFLVRWLAKDAGGKTRVDIN